MIPPPPFLPDLPTPADWPWLKAPSHFSVKQAPQDGSVWGLLWQRAPKTSNAAARCCWSSSLPNPQETEVPEMEAAEPRWRLPSVPWSGPQCHCSPLSSQVVTLEKGQASPCQVLPTCERPWLEL